jgi:uncharacterized membrane protein
LEIGTSQATEKSFVHARGFTAPCGMVHDASNKAGPDSRRRYRWPWFVLAALCAAIALAILWLSAEIERTRRIRDLNAPMAPNHP